MKQLIIISLVVLVSFVMRGEEEEDGMRVTLVGKVKKGMKILLTEKKDEEEMESLYFQKSYGMGLYRYRERTLKILSMNVNLMFNVKGNLYFSFEAESNTSSYGNLANKNFDIQMSNNNYKVRLLNYYRLTKKNVLLFVEFHYSILNKQWEYGYDDGIFLRESGEGEDKGVGIGGAVGIEKIITKDLSLILKFDLLTSEFEGDGGTVKENAPSSFEEPVMKEKNSIRELSFSVRKLVGDNTVF